MAYIDVTHIYAAYAQAAMQEGLDIDLDAALDTDYRDEVIAQADGKTYGWIAAKYPSVTPASVTPSTSLPVLRRISGVVAAWIIAGRSSKYLKTMYEEEKAYAERIGKGEIPLQGETRGDLPDSIRKDAKRETRDAAKYMADYGEPSPNDTSNPLTDNTYRATF